MFNLLRLFLVITIWVSSQMVMGEIVIKVISSNTSKYPVGTILTEKTKFDFKQEDKIRVKITGSSKIATYNFDGPFNSDSGSGFIESIKKLFRPKRAGTTTDSQLLEQMKNPWLLVVSEDRNFCYIPNSPIKLWRPNAKKKVKVKVSDTTINWGVNKDTLEFPTDKLAKKYTRYPAEIGKNILVSLHKIPSKLISNTSKGKWMIEKGCKRQAVALFQE